MASSVYTAASEMAMLTTVAGVASVTASEVVVLVSIGPPISAYVEVGELYALRSTESAGMSVQVEEVYLLTTYVTGPRQILNNRAWGFTFDGHQFYVLSLYTVGTFVYDLTTKQWAQFSTQGFNGLWNFEHGVEWNNGVYAADIGTNQIWRLNPDSFLDDDFRPILRKVTAGVNVDGRDTVKTGALIVNAQAQAYGVTDTPTITLSISDDAGATFRVLNMIALTASTVQIDWRSLGAMKSPGRVFLLEDSGGLTKIDSATLAVAGEKKK